jgi:non-heme chloroperoxidase
VLFVAFLTCKELIMSTITTSDGTEIYYKDWGEGPAVTLSHGWPLSADMWNGQMLFLAQHGFRCIAHDRRGHGRSSQASSGNDMDGYADDLAAVIEALDLRDVTVVAHSTGCGEVARYIGRHGTARVAKAVLISGVPPTLVKSEANPNGLPSELFDAFLAGMFADRSQFYLDLASQFYGANRPGSHVSQGVLDQFWTWSMQSGLKNSYECVKSLSEADFTADLERFDVPTLLMHGEDDQVVPASNSMRLHRRGAGGLGDLGEAGVSAEAPGEDGRTERFEVRLACKSVVEGLEVFRRLEEQWRGVASPIAGEDDLGPQPRQSGLQKVIERADLRRRHQRIGGAVISGLELRLCGRERSCGPRARVNCQLERLLQKCRRGRDTTSAPGALGGAFQVSCDALVELRRRVRPMPGAPIGFHLRVRHLGERLMNGLAVSDTARPVGRGADQRVAEPDPGTELDQPVFFSRWLGVSPDAEQFGGALEQDRVAQGFGGSDEQQSLCLLRERSDARQEAVLDLPCQWSRSGHGEATGQLACGRAARQLQQGERVAAGLGDDPVSHSLVQPPRKDRVQQRPSLAVRQATDLAFRQTLQLSRGARFAHGEHQSDGLSQQPPRDEGEDLPGELVEPLRVVDQADERPLLGGGRQQSQHCQPDEEAIGWHSGGQAERRAEGVALGTRQVVHAVQHRRAQLMRACVGKLDL